MTRWARAQSSPTAPRFRITLTPRPRTRVMQPRESQRTNSWPGPSPNAWRREANDRLLTMVPEPFEIPLRRSQMFRWKREPFLPANTRPPLGLRTAKLLPSPEIRISGGGAAIKDNSTAKIASTPARRQVCCQRISHRPPNVMSAKPHHGMVGTRTDAPGLADIALATAITISMPHPMGTNARDSRPNGMRI